MPLDNMAKYWYNLFVNTLLPSALGPVMHAIQDASIPHHAAGYNGNWHVRYERDLNSNIHKWFGDTNFVNEILRLFKLWVKAKGSLPTNLMTSDWRKVPTVGSRSDTLVTWVALNAYKEYAQTYGHFKRRYGFNQHSAKKLVRIATAMSMFFLYKAIHDRSAKLMLSFENRDKFWGIKCYLQSRRETGHFIRHKNSLAEVTEIKTNLDRQDATFRIVPGLADADSISFESVNRPGYYLRHENLRIKLAQHNGTKLFKEDATFRVRPGGLLGQARGLSFESFNYPVHFIRQKKSSLYIDNLAGALSRRDWSFMVDKDFLILWKSDNLLA